MILAFLDASALVPMELTSDQWARAFARVMGGLRAAPRLCFLTTNWTLHEALAITQRAGKHRAVALHGRVTSRATVVAVDPEVEAEAIRRFLAWQDKGASVVDYANLLVAQKFRCQAVISFDSDFAPLVRGTGIRLLD
jgi:predicted nucleic acid-binding protein